MEIWKDIQGFEGCYQVSNKGNVKTLFRVLIMSDGRKKTINERLLNLSKTSNGYLKVDLFRNNKKDRYKRYSVHRLVAIHFLPLIDGLKEVNHLDGDKENNNSCNLEWSNRSLNLNHAFKSGLKKVIGLKGVQNKQSKLNDEIVREIRSNDNNLTVSQMVIKYKVSRQVIFGVVKGNSWKHVE